MIPVAQAGLDCFAAATASILELPLSDVPPFGPDIDWAPEWQRFLLARNLFQVTVPVDRTWKDVPPGYSILCCRTTDDNPAKLDWMLHSLVCRNGKPAWDPNGYRLPLDWDGLIEGRSWQAVEPVCWVVFATLDPTVPTHMPVAESEPFTEMMEEARALLEKMQRRTPPSRGGVNFPYFRNHMDKVLAAYTDAPTDEEGERAAIATFRSLAEDYAEVQTQLQKGK